MGVKRGCARDHPVAGNRDAVEAAAKAHHHGPDPAIPHDQVRADAHGKDRGRGVERLEERRQIGLVLGLKQAIRRPPHPKPGQIGERAVRGQPPAYRRERYHGSQAPSRGGASCRLTHRQR